MSGLNRDRGSFRGRGSDPAERAAAVPESHRERRGRPTDEEAVDRGARLFASTELAERGRECRLRLLCERPSFQKLSAPTQKAERLAGLPRAKSAAGAMEYVDRGGQIGGPIDDGARGAEGNNLVDRKGLNRARKRIRVAHCWRENGRGRDGRWIRTKRQDALGQNKF